MYPDPDNVMVKSKKTKTQNKKTQTRLVIYIAFFIALVFAVAGYLIISSKSDAQVPVSDEDHGKNIYGQVTFHTPGGEKIIDLLVEVAEEEYEQATGLMFREDLTESQGMIFVYDDEDMRYFWMKNTPMSLDMIFINSEMKIIHIEKYTKPMSENLYPSKYPAQYIVETIAGFTDQYDIRVGSRIEWHPPENSG
jgi:hypothetical protein